MDNNIDFIARRFGINLIGVNIAELKDFLDLSTEKQKLYKWTCSMHPEWSHAQIMTSVCVMSSYDEYSHDITV